MKSSFLPALVLTMALFATSCIKDNLTPKSSVPLTAATDGGIIDLGEAAPGVHHFSISLSTVQLEKTGSGTDKSETTSAVIELYSNTDGIINDGTYHFTGSGEIIPFTFKSGTLYGAPTDDSSYSAFSVSGGSLSVQRTGNSYLITIKGLDSAGESFTGSFNGNLSYEDKY